MKPSIRERLGRKSTKELKAIWVRLKMPGSSNRKKIELIIWLRQHLEMRSQWKKIVEL